jgi:hypothetical protein
MGIMHQPLQLNKNINFMSFYNGNLIFLTVALLSLLISCFAKLCVTLAGPSTSTSKTRAADFTCRTMLYPRDAHSASRCENLKLRLRVPRDGHRPSRFYQPQELQFSSIILIEFMSHQYY